MTMLKEIIVDVYQNLSLSLSPTPPPQHTHTYSDMHTHLKRSSRGIPQELVLFLVVDHDSVVERKEPLIEGLVDVRLLEHVALENRVQEIHTFQEVFLVMDVAMVMMMLLAHGVLRFIGGLARYLDDNWLRAKTSRSMAE